MTHQDLHNNFENKSNSVKNNLKSDQGRIDAQSLEMCIVVCNECAKICSSTLNYCLRKDEHHVESSHIKNLVACAEICSLNAIWMSRDFDLHTKLCQVCAEVCESCAASCEKVGMKDAADSIMAECVDICQRCAQTCARMAAH